MLLRRAATSLPARLGAASWCRNSEVAMVAAITRVRLATSAAAVVETDTKTTASDDGQSQVLRQALANIQRTMREFSSSVSKGSNVGSGKAQRGKQNAPKSPLTFADTRKSTVTALRTIIASPQAIRFTSHEDGVSLLANMFTVCKLSASATATNAPPDPNQWLSAEEAKVLGAGCLRQFATNGQFGSSLRVSQSQLARALSVASDPAFFMTTAENGIPEVDVQAVEGLCLLCGKAFQEKAFGNLGVIPTVLPRIVRVLHTVCDDARLSRQLLQSSPGAGELPAAPAFAPLKTLTAELLRFADAAFSVIAQIGKRAKGGGAGGGKANDKTLILPVLAAVELIDAATLMVRLRTNLVLKARDLSPLLAGTEINAMRLVTFVQTSRIVMSVPELGDRKKVEAIAKHKESAIATAPLRLILGSNAHANALEQLEAVELARPTPPSRSSLQERRTLSKAAAGMLNAVVAAAFADCSEPDAAIATASAVESLRLSASPMKPRLAKMLASLPTEQQLKLLELCQRPNSQFATLTPVGVVAVARSIADITDPAQLTMLVQQLPSQEAIRCAAIRRAAKLLPFAPDATDDDAGVTNVAPWVAFARVAAAPAAVAEAKRRVSLRSFDPSSEEVAEKDSTDIAGVHNDEALVAFSERLAAVVARSAGKGTLSIDAMLEAVAGGFVAVESLASVVTADTDLTSATAGMAVGAVAMAAVQLRKCDAGIVADAMAAAVVQRVVRMLENTDGPAARLRVLKSQLTGADEIVGTAECVFHARAQVGQTVAAALLVDLTRLGIASKAQRHIGSVPLLLSFCCDGDGSFAVTRPKPDVDIVQAVIVASCQESGTTSSSSSSSAAVALPTTLAAGADAESGSMANVNAKLYCKLASAAVATKRLGLAATLDVPIEDSIRKHLDVVPPAAASRLLRACEGLPRAHRRAMRSAMSAFRGLPGDLATHDVQIEVLDAIARGGAGASSVNRTVRDIILTAAAALPRAFGSSAVEATSTSGTVGDGFAAPEPELSVRWIAALLNVAGCARVSDVSRALDSLAAIVATKSAELSAEDVVRVLNGSRHKTLPTFLPAAVRGRVIQLVAKAGEEGRRAAEQLAPFAAPHYAGDEEMWNAIAHALGASAGTNATLRNAFHEAALPKLRP